MRVKIEQPKDFDEGYARVIIYAEAGESLAEDDSIAIGVNKTGILEYIDPKGGDHWSSAPQRLFFHQKPEITPERAVFILQPLYVTPIDDQEVTSVEVDLLDRNGDVKNKTAAVNWPEMYTTILGPTDTIHSYKDEEKQPEKPKPVKKRAVQILADESESPDETAAGEADEAVLKNSDASAAEKASAVGSMYGLLDGMDEELDGEGSRTEESASAEEMAEEAANSNSGDAAEENASESQASNAQTSELAEQESSFSSKQARSISDTVNAPEEKRGKSFVWAAVGLILLALAGGGGWYYMTTSSPEADAAKMEDQAEAENQAAEAARAEAEKKAAEEAARAEAEKKAAEEAARADTRARVAAFFKGSPNPEAAMALAKDVDKENADQKDAVFRLYYYAATNGNEEGAAEYARCLDPTQAGWGSIAKDAVEAWNYYSKIPGGEEARKNLKAWVERQAATGNSTAREWLSGME